MTHDESRQLPPTPPTAEHADGRLTSAPSSGTLFSTLAGVPASNNGTEICELLAGLLAGGDGRRCFKVVLEGAKLVELSVLNDGANTVTAQSASGWLSMDQTAARLRHSYHWVSRNWRRLGLRPKEIGRVLFFRSADIDALINRSAPQRTRGRQKKIVGVLNAPG